MSLASAVAPTAFYSCRQDSWRCISELHLLLLLSTCSLRLYGSANCQFLSADCFIHVFLGIIFSNSSEETPFTSGWWVAYNWTSVQCWLVPGRECCFVLFWYNCLTIYVVAVISMLHRRILHLQLFILHPLLSIHLMYHCHKSLTPR